MLLSKNLITLSVPITIFLLAFLLVTLTLPSFGVTFDEFNYFHSCDLQFRWLGLLVKAVGEGNIGEVLSDQTIRTYWHWEPFYVPHPPLSRTLSGITKTLFYPIFDLFSAYRLSVILLYSGLAALLFLWAKQLYGFASGLVSALIWILMPHVFGQAHIASADMPLTFFWFATTYAFYKGTRAGVWSLVFALLLGLAVSTKFPGFLIPIPLVAWAWWTRKQGCFRNLAAMTILCPSVLLALQPYLWTNPSGRLFEFIHQSLTRMRHPGARIPTYFFHQPLLGDQLPFYYPFFIVAVSIPLLVLFLFLAGNFFKSSDQNQREVNSLLRFNLLFILLVPVLPGSFIHDGVRLLLPAFPFLAFLSGAGFFYVKERLIAFVEKDPGLEKAPTLAKILERGSAFLEKKAPWAGPGKKTLIPLVLALVLLLPTAWEMYDSHPNQLMYYNSLVGGVKGAYRLGLETTYLGEAFNQEFFEFLNRSLPPGAVLNASFATPTFWNIQRQGLLRKDIQFSVLDFEYYILLCRRGYLLGFDHWLFENRQPVSTREFKGVPLIQIYRFQEQDRFWKTR